MVFLGVLNRGSCPNENICFAVDVFAGCCVGCSCVRDRDIVDLFAELALSLLDGLCLY